MSPVTKPKEITKIPLRLRNARSIFLLDGTLTLVWPTQSHKLKTFSVSNCFTPNMLGVGENPCYLGSGLMTDAAAT